MFRNVVCSEDYFIRVVPRVCGYVGVVAVEPVEKVSERSREAVYDSERFVVVVARCYDAVSERFVIIHNFPPIYQLPINTFFFKITSFVVNPIIINLLSFLIS